VTSVLEREHTIDITALERSLRDTWNRTIRESATPLHRALTMNLIAVAHSDAEDLIRETITRFRVRHPCLAFLILLHDRPVEMSAALLTHVRQGEDSRQLLLEQISIRIAREDADKIPGLLLPLVVGDISTLLFWAHEIPEEPTLLCALAQMADVFVYDSTLFGLPSAELDRVSRLALRGIDLTWLRLHPWRRAIAEAFETVQWSDGARTSIRLTVPRSQSAIPAAIRIGQWLHERLGAIVRIEADGNAIGPESEPSEIHIEFDRVHIRVRHLWPTPRLQIRVSTTDICMLPFETTASTGSRGDLLAAAADS
jgi:glucose-6-phosphate dehydrogenase assembly protein OpcA